MQKTLLLLGCGYSAQFLAIGLLRSVGSWHVTGTTRDDVKAETLLRAGIAPLLFDGKTVSDALRRAIGSATHIVHSIAPDAKGDCISHLAGAQIASSKNLRWFGYLSTTGVYGDRQGGWVDEGDAPMPNNERSTQRAVAENNWLNAYSENKLPVHIFRLAGIYGPGRSVIDDLKAGTARRIIKPGQFFSRIHVEDIANILIASMQYPCPGEIYNLCDDEPAPSSDVVEYASHLLAIEPPPAIPFTEAELSPMARSFYQSNRRVRNDKIKRELRIALAYPTYREGLAHLLQS